MSTAACEYVTNEEATTNPLERSPDPGSFEPEYREYGLYYVPTGWFKCQRWPDLRFDAKALTTYTKVWGIIQGLIFADERELAERFVGLADRLDYLNGFGGDRYRVSLGYDFAHLSFSICWFARVPDNVPLPGARYDAPYGDGWTRAFCGGLIWHGGTNDPLCIRIGNDSNMWGVHT